MVSRGGLDSGFGERDPQMSVLGQFVVVHSDERVDGRLNVLHLAQRHFVILSETKGLRCCRWRIVVLNSRKEFEGFHRKAVRLECFGKRLLGDVRWNVRQMQGTAGRIDVHVIFATRLLETVQRRMRIVSRETRIWLAWNRILRSEWQDLQGASTSFSYRN